MRLALHIVSALAAMILAVQAHAGEREIHRRLVDALLCKNDADAVAEVVQGLVERGSNFEAGYAGYGFGDDTSYRALVILRKPLRIAGAKASAVISEAENSHADFAAFTYARFEGDYEHALEVLGLEAADPFTDTSLGRFVSQQPSDSGCPPTIALTPIDETHFLLGCGWCNGG